MTLGELARRIDALLSEVRQTRIEMVEHNRRYESEFLRKTEFEARQAADVAQVRGLESEVHSIQKRLDSTEDRRRTDRALIISSFIAPLVVALLVAFLLRSSGG